MGRKNRHPILEKVLIEDYAAEGKSLAKLDGKVIFVGDAVPGDIVDVRLGKNKKDWAEGHAIRFHEFSAERVSPFCIHFGVCGGCQWQMLPYEKQLVYKANQVKQTLTRIGRVDLPPISPIMGCDVTRGYRNKMEYTFGNRRYLLPGELKMEDISADQPVAGFHAKGIFDKVVNITECHLQAEPTNLIRNAVRDFGIEHGYSFYDIRNHHGLLRTMQVRLCRSGQLMVNLVFGQEDEVRIRKLLDHLLQQFPQITTLLYTINTKWNDSLHDLAPQVYHGNGFVIETLEDFRFKIGPKSFFQTNTYQGEKLYQVTRQFAGLTGNETVYDLYCGTGSIGIFLSRQAGKIIGVEMIREAIEDARVNAGLNGVEHARFFSGDVTDICDSHFFEQHGRPDVIITDPPRAGMSPQLVNKINEMEAPVVVYVSCNPATQARDLSVLGEKYTVAAVQPVDMFPHTHHIENVVKLELRR